MANAREDVTWFADPVAWRGWLAQHHASATELWVGLRKKQVTGGLSYAEALDEALCFGWIDGQTHGVDDRGYAIRFMPRAARSIWSAVNLKRIEELQSEGRLAEAGRLAWENRDPARAGLYTHEQDDIALDPASEARFRSHDSAWAWFQSQPPGYRRQVTWWVVSAKRPETRERRLDTLIQHSENQQRVAAFR